MKRESAFGFLVLVIMGLISLPASAYFVVPGSVTNGVVDPGAEGDTEARATDDDYLSRLFIGAQGGPGTRVSFVVDLEGLQEIRSVAMYGRPWYDGAISMFSDDVTVEAGDSATGPFTWIGSINVGHTRPTDPDPTVGGENPWTGGNGRVIPCTPTTCSFLRISGDQGFDNNILLYHLIINPRVTIHRMDPVQAAPGDAFQPLDFGGGPNNSRAAVDCVDGKFNTRTFWGLDVKLTLDLGIPTQVNEFRFHCSDNDTHATLRLGVIRTSTIDDPNTFDTQEEDFEAAGIGGGQAAHPKVRLTNQPTKRFFQIEFKENSSGISGDGASPVYRMSELDYRAVSESPINTAAVVVGSVADGTVDPSAEGDVEGQGFDLDYNERFFITQQSQPRTSFVVDLGASQEVHSVAFYGDWAYRTQIAMLGNEIIVEAGNSATGPFTQIGMLDVGSTRPTDPDPTVGGENPFTGGNGRRVACTPTQATHLRISGSYGFDNNILIYEMVVNHVLHQVDPVDQGQTLWDIGGGPLNSRCGAEAVDGNLTTRLNPRFVPFSFTIDAGPTPVKIKEIRIFPMDNDISPLPRYGIVRTSSTDSPTNMDTIENDFSTGDGIPYQGGTTIIPLPNKPEKRFVQITFTGAQSGGPEDGVPVRMGEIEVIGEPAGVVAVQDWVLY